MDEYAEARVRLAEKEIFEYIGNVVRDKRKERGWTQKTLAKELKTTQSRIADIENGMARLSMVSLSNLCVALDLPMDIRLVPRKPQPFKTQVVRVTDEGCVYVWIGGPINI